jgi:hypothetical protein
MKCIDCGRDFSVEKIDRQIKVELSNPGIVVFNGKVIECPNCKEKYTEESDIVELLDNFEKSHVEKNKLFKKA